MNWQAGMLLVGVGITAACGSGEGGGGESDATTSSGTSPVSAASEGPSDPTADPSSDGDPSGSGGPVGDTSGGVDPDSGSEGGDGTDGSGDSTGGGPAGPPEECVATVDAANAFLAALDGGQSDEVSFEWDDNQRRRFEFLPPNSAARAGLTLRDVDDPQTVLIDDFLAAAMSAPGLMQVEEVRALESVLAMQESGQPTTSNRDPQNYFISIFGTPNVDDGTPWGWRFEGHHLSIHASMLNCERFSATPAFWGASPNLGPIQDEADMAEQLWDALDNGQQGQAQANIGADALSQKVGLIDMLAMEGVAAGDLDAEPLGLLRDLVAKYAGTMNAPVAQQRITAIEDAGFENVRFAYDDSDSSWRVLGPTFVIEFIYESSTHVHSVWRDYDGDYGEDLIARHLELQPHHHHHGRGHGSH